MKSHPLPPLEQGIEDADTYAYIDDNLASFLRLSDSPSPNEKLPLELLDDTDPADIKQRLGDETAQAFLQAGTDNLGVRAIMWAMSVVGERGVRVAGDEGVSLFVGAGDEGWMYDAGGEVV